MMGVVIMTFYVNQKQSVKELVQSRFIIGQCNHVPICYYANWLRYVPHDTLSPIN